ncbi:hypothetical protein HNY73_007497 [Argiope bruennichi]|uniref:Uncharacterized protein n=1 Tax=Argiope bruennichi TaxID=94029 RepID=A0A8T0FE42_ARGBR|nr:hypothetical protein HNY73_007497 [Argiope bruennichi]
MQIGDQSGVVPTRVSTRKFQRFQRQSIHNFRDSSTRVLTTFRNRPGPQELQRSSTRGSELQRLQHQSPQNFRDSSTRAQSCRDSRPVPECSSRFRTGPQMFVEASCPRVPRYTVYAVTGTPVSQWYEFE